MAPEKTEGPTTSLSLLGVELDTELMELRLSQKLLKLRELVKNGDDTRPARNGSSNH